MIRLSYLPDWPFLDFGLIFLVDSASTNSEFILLFTDQDARSSNIRKLVVEVKPACRLDSFGLFCFRQHGQVLAQSPVLAELALVTI